MHLPGVVVSSPVQDWLARISGPAAHELAGRLRGRNGSVFKALDAATSTTLAADMLAALAADLGDGLGDGLGDEQTALRALLTRVTHELTPKGLGYADLRLLAVSTRQVLVAAMSEAPQLELTTRTRVDEWVFQLALLGAMRYVAQRERSFQEQAARLEVRQLEGQLHELKAAYEEKTRLLDVIRQASTPITPVYDGILVVPLVGVVDSFRARVLTETLLAGVVEARAQVVILDISGVPVFDAEAAEHIINTARAVRLLGTQLILVGLSPTIASAIVELGVDLGGLTTLGTLQAGLARALTLRHLQVVPMPGQPRKHGS